MINFFAEEPLGGIGILVLLVVFIILSYVGILSIYVPTTIAILMMGLVWFYRQPTIELPRYLLQSNEVYSPAYGTVVSLVTRNNHYMVSIFLSVFDIHIQYFPVSGVVVEQKHSPHEVSTIIRNLISNTTDNQITVVQRTGYVARRISTPNHIGKHIHAGDRLGMIKFGSHVDLILPNYYKLEIKPGDVVYGPYTRIASY